MTLASASLVWKFVRLASVSLKRKKKKDMIVVVCTVYRTLFLEFGCSLDSTKSHSLIFFLYNLSVISQSTLFLQNMEEAHSVNSPRRVLSFSKRRKQKPFGFQDSDSISSSTLRASQVHGPKPSEVYGFVGSISTVVATVIFLIWAYVPDKLLESIGIHYYPSRYWVLAMPTYLMVTLLLGLAFYVGLNFIATPHPTSLSTLFGECPQYLAI